MRAVIEFAIAISGAVRRHLAPWLEATIPAADRKIGRRTGNPRNCCPSSQCGVPQTRCKWRGHFLAPGLFGGFTRTTTAAAPVTRTCKPSILASATPCIRRGGLGGTPPIRSARTGWRRRSGITRCAHHPTAGSGKLSCPLVPRESCTWSRSSNGTFCPIWRAPGWKPMHSKPRT